MNFDEFMESVKPLTLKASDLLNGKIRFCLVGVTEFIEGSYQGKATYQHRSDIVHLINGDKVNDSVYLPGGKLWQNFFAGIEKHPEFRHNLYLVKEGNAYAIKQGSGVCPCRHGSNGHSPQQQEQQPDFFTPDGDAVTLSTQPGSITAKQSRSILTLALSLKREPPDDDILESMSEQQADAYILKLRASAVGA